MKRAFCLNSDVYVNEIQNCTDICDVVGVFAQLFCTQNLALLISAIMRVESGESICVVLLDLTDKFPSQDMKFIIPALQKAKH